MSKDKGFLLAVVVMVLVLLVGVSTVLALSTVTVSNVYTVVEVSSDQIEVYGDAACTEILRDVNFGDIPQGADSVPVSAYVKNMGTSDVSVEVAHSDLETGITLHNDTSPFPLAVGTSIEYQWYISVADDASLGGGSFTLYFNSNVDA